MGQDPKPTPHSRAAARAAEVERRGTVLAKSVEPSAHPEAALPESLASLLFPFLLRDDGYLRVIGKEDGETVYWKWKFSGGKYINHYVMAVYPASECAEALRRLAKKLDAVDRGIEAPVQDHYFKR